MAITYGFYNALNNDRLYDAIQMSSIFDGIILDGVFSTIGDSFIVTAPGEDMFVNVGSGRAWFNHTWTLNDTEYPIEVPESELVLSRIDALVLEVDSSVEVRANTIKFVKGTPSSNPVKPTLTHTVEVNQYALAYITVGPGVQVITQDKVENVVGTDETPFITGLLQQLSISEILIQWAAEWDTYFADFKEDAKGDMAAEFAEINDWFQHMKGQLSEDAAIHLQNELDNVVGRLPSWSLTVTGIVGDTSITIEDERITSTSSVELFKEVGTANVNLLSKEITEGQIVYTFDPLEESTTFRVRITNTYSFGYIGNEPIYFADLGDVEFDTPLDGQVVVYDGVLNKFTNKNLGIDFHWSNAVSCLTGDTDCTIQDTHILPTSVIEPVSDPPGLPYTDMTVTNGQVVITFSALTQAASIKVRITN